MFQSLRVTLPLNIINNEYILHRDRFHDKEDFRRYIVKQNEKANGRFKNGNAVIKYETFYGIYKNWTLTNFVTEHELSLSKKKKKKYKSKRKNKITSDGRTYEEDKMRNGNIKITKRLTTEIVPNRVKQNIQNVFGYMRKYATLNQPSQDGKIWILNLGLTDKKSNEPVYFIADRISRNATYSYTWQMREKIYNQQEVTQLTKLTKNQLPKAVTDTHEFTSKLKNVAQMEKIVNDEKNRTILFHTNVKWENVAVFANEKETNKTQLHLNKSKPIFVNECKVILRNMGHVSLKPILLFNHNPNKKEIYNIDALLRIRINENDIGISFKYKDGKMLPSGFHLDLANIVLMYQLANPYASDITYFNGWHTTINDMAIGNKDKYKNQFNAKKMECQMYKNRDDKYADIVSGVLTELMTLQKQGLKITRNLSYFIKEGNHMLQSSNKNDAMFGAKTSTADNCSNEDYKHDNSHAPTAVHSPQTNINQNQDSTQQFILLPINQFGIVQGVNVQVIRITAPILIQPVQTMETTIKTKNVATVQQSKLKSNMKSSTLDINAIEFIPMQNQSKLKTIMEKTSD